MPRWASRPAGAIWLNEDMLSAYEFWQFWRNTLDADVGRFLKLYTELPMDEIARLEALQGQEINQAKIVLANEVTAMCHGKAAAGAAETTARETFVAGGAGEDLPTITLPREDVAQGVANTSLFVEAGLVRSSKEARRLISDGGARINDVVETAVRVLTAEEFGTGLKLSAGKKRHALAKLE